MLSVTLEITILELKSDEKKEQKIYEKKTHV
jgi:hypothetical protein